LEQTNNIESNIESNLDKDRNFIHFNNNEQCEEFVKENKIEPLWYCCRGEGIAVKKSEYENFKEKALNKYKRF
jgi:hypothetical protein